MRELCLTPGPFARSILQRDGWRPVDVAGQEGWTSPLTAEPVPLERAFATNVTVGPRARARRVVWAQRVSRFLGKDGWTYSGNDQWTHTHGLGACTANALHRSSLKRLEQWIARHTFEVEPEGAKATPRVAHPTFIKITDEQTGKELGPIVLPSAFTQVRFDELRGTMVKKDAYFAGVDPGFDDETGVAIAKQVQLKPVTVNVEDLRKRLRDRIFGFLSDQVFASMRQRVTQPAARVSKVQVFESVNALSVNGPVLEHLRFVEMLAERDNVEVAPVYLNPGDMARLRQEVGDRLAVSSDTVRASTSES